MKNIWFIAFFLFLVSCNNEKKVAIDVSNIKMNVVVDRFEQEFYTTEPENLQALKQKYPFLFPNAVPDSIWLGKIASQEEIELFKQTNQLFGNFDTETRELTNLFKHIKYYHPKFKEPKVITLITDLDYESKVIYADSLLFISLDMYLGKTNPVYSDFPDYLKESYEKTNIQVDVASAILNANFIDGPKRQFLDVIVNEGKKMFLIDTYLPEVENYRKMGYSSEKMEWLLANEAEIWKYFIENKILYSTDSKLYTRFIANAPFSKFYLDIDKQSPGRVGVYLGWQIVKSYMNNNTVTLQELLQTNAEEIFSKSKYKPKK